MRLTTIILIIIVGILFVFNYDICSHFYNPDTETAEWWNLRFKFYSVVLNLLGLVIFLNVDRITKIAIIPVFAMFLGDLKDRVFFDYTDRDWSDWLLFVLSIIFVVIILRNDKSRTRHDKGSAELDNTNSVLNSDN